MLNAIRYARECKVPYFGICLGMQTMVIEFARNVCGLDACQFHRVRSGYAASRHLQAARIEGRRRAGRHHAPGRVSLPAGRRQLRARGLRNARKSASATAIATNSTANTKTLLTAARLAPDRRDSRRRLRRDLRDWRTIPGIWAASSIRSSNRSRWSRIRCSGRSSARRLEHHRRRRARSPGTSPARMISRVAARVHRVPSRN